MFRLHSTLPVQRGHHHVQIQLGIVLARVSAINASSATSSAGNHSATRYTEARQKRVSWMNWRISGFISRDQ